MAREGLKITEVYELARAVKENIELGEDDDVAFNLGARTMRTATTPETLKKWKPYILKLAKGERVPELDAELPPKPASTPPGASVYANLEAARAEAEKLKSVNADAAKEIERLKAELAKKK